MSSDSRPKSSSGLLSFPAWSTAAVLGLFIATWSEAVNSIVTEPYLDEFFHVRQAQKYINGNYADWDDKITTPPGLYVLSTGIARLTGFHSLTSLRGLNAVLLLLLVFIILDLDTQLGLGRLRRTRQESEREASHAPLASSSYTLVQLHSALNICLFPVLFFYSALYYTDIASVASVLICWNHFVRINQQENDPSVLQGISSILLGLVSLTFRQTNIFWVAVFPAAILLVSYIDSGLANDPNEDENLLDPPVRESHMDDYFFFMMSLAIKTLKAAYTTFCGNWAYLRLIRLLVPYIAILAAFGAFVIWNGGVVLGDKSNHIATIHMTQMLYLWPYMIFFSAPMSLVYLIQGLFGLILVLPIFTPLEYSLMFKRKRFIPRKRLLIAFALVAAPVIYYNTILHPFTLADNRHYPFYVFRLLTRHRAIKFAVIPIYYLGAWATIQTLGAPATLRMVKPGQREHDVPTSISVPKAERIGAAEKAGPSIAQPLRLNHAAAGEGAPVSFVIIWLVTTALNLVTAPLVEPRYFILPWLMWRLRVPQSTVKGRTSIMSTGEKGQNRSAGNGSLGNLKRLLWDEHDHRLWLETAWFLIINAGTGYMFLYRGFEWVQEPGKVQRFMW